MIKIPCGGFYINDSDFNISEEGELSLKGGSSSGEVFVVNIEFNEGEGLNQLSVSYNELKEAYDNDKLIILKYEEISLDGVSYMIDYFSNLAEEDNDYTVKFLKSTWKSSDPNTKMEPDIV